MSNGSSQHRIETTRRLLRLIPRVEETLQWGDNLVFWTLNKAVGGKIFAVMPVEPGERHVIAFAAGPVRMAQLLEIDGVQPAPYFARAHWVALQDWGVLSSAELEAELRAAYAYVFNRMPPRVQRLQDLPGSDYRALVRERSFTTKKNHGQ